MKNVLQSLVKKVQIQLKLAAAESAADERIYIKKLGSGTAIFGNVVAYVK